MTSLLIRTLTTVPAALILAGALVTAQTDKPVCDLVTEKDAAAVLGSVQKKNSILGADQCVFTTPGLSLMVNRLTNQEPETIDMLLKLPANRARQGDIVKDEPGIGQKAVSEVSKGHLLIIAASGTTVWNFSVDHVYSRDISEMLPKLRELAAKTAR